ncbi:GGDEF domain-containing protein [Rhodoferax sp. TS-BS-61-7]|uniref:GGDEF domain-containing protein n=1 Tax=Rhodoferax sp. TS-BS-61-7 TaxID=2094194 RepID=UPI000CF6D152|nr:GGDEF domain-containing protein [Rhodoferax sp. TS-BS-61-7]PQA78481.1 GGDEF domain-containing protein [Rhodoferax sp. TS-BS-61-7]
MEKLNVLTILVLTALNLSTVSVALLLIMGKGISRAARLAQFSLLSQTLGWVAIISSGFVFGHWLDPVLSTAAMVLASVANYLMFLALQAWLGPRPNQRALIALMVLMPLGYALSFEHYSLRVGYANLMFALQLTIVAQAALGPRQPGGLRWRALVCLCYAAVACASLARGVLGAFYPELYPTFDAPHIVNVLAQLTANMALVLTTVAVLVAWREEAEGQLREQAFTDNITGLLNRHGWDDRAPALFDQARRHNTPLALILLDLDHFKRVNDTQGHEVGDQVLRLVGKVLQSNRRSSDLAARIGGEEFALLLPQTDKRAALHVEQRLRLALLEEGIQQPTLRVGYSAGLALLQAGDRKLTDFMVRADAALYQAKAQGRGRLLQAD